MSPPRPRSTPTESQGSADDERFAHFFRCWDRPGGPGHDLREKVDRLRMWQAVVTAIAALLQGAGLVVLAWWLSSRLPAPKPERASSPATLIPQAHAETKGSP